MAAIVADQASSLKDLGFRKRRHCFNRQVADGIVHVVYFWMAPKEPPAWTEVPGLRERRYGQFRLDFGVYVPEMKRTKEPRSAWINDYDCHLRRTIGELRGATSDLWWEIDDPGASVVARDALVAHGIPWLDSFPDRASVIDGFRRLGALALGMGPAGALDVADLLRAIGRPGDERRVLEEYVERDVPRSHATYLTDYLRARGHDDLCSRISVRPS